MAGKTTAFLSHSHLDRRLAEGIQVYLNGEGWNVYIDWMDDSMPDQISSATAERLQAKILENDYFLLLATQNSCRVSRWCPWEIGYADGKKLRTKILIIPTQDDNGYEYGSEYLGLYRRIERMTSTDSSFIGAAVMPPSGEGFWVKSLY